MAPEFESTPDRADMAARTESAGGSVGELPSPSNAQGGLSPPQFSVASLLALVTLVAMVLALSDAIGAYGTFWLVIFLIAVFAHIAGNSLGNQLRDHGNRADRPPPGQPSPTRVEYAPRTQLGDRSAVGFWVVAATFVGALTGAVGGGYWLVHSLGEHFTVSSLLVALVAFAVLGGIWSFLSVGFLRVLIGAWRQSTRHK